MSPIPPRDKVCASRSAKSTPLLLHSLCWLEVALSRFRTFAVMLLFMVSTIGVVFDAGVAPRRQSWGPCVETQNRTELYVVERLGRTGKRTSTAMLRACIALGTPPLPQVPGLLGVVGAVMVYFCVDIVAID